MADDDTNATNCVRAENIEKKMWIVSRNREVDRVCTTQVISVHEDYECARLWARSYCLWEYGDVCDDYGRDVFESSNDDYKWRFTVEAMPFVKVLPDNEDEGKARTAWRRGGLISDMHDITVYPSSWGFDQ